MRQINNLLYRSFPISMQITDHQITIYSIHLRVIAHQITNSELLCYGFQLETRNFSLEPSCLMCNTLIWYRKELNDSTNYIYSVSTYLQHIYKKKCHRFQFEQKKKTSIFRGLYFRFLISTHLCNNLIKHTLILLAST